MIKGYAKKFLRQIVPHLPWGAREVLFEALCEQIGLEAVVARVVPRLGNIGLWAEGEYGLIQSAPDDTVVLPLYGRTGTYGRRLVKLLGTFFRERGGGTYLDIGGNIGLTTIPVARDPKVKCLIFEPEPTNFKNMTANLLRNCAHDNYICHQVALFDRRAQMKLSVASGNRGDHRISLWAELERETIEISAAPLDEFIDEISGAVAVKIDTQGAEPFVISGGRETLSRASIVVLEFSPYLMACMGSDPNIIFDFLSGFDLVGLGTPEGEELPKFRPWKDVSRILSDTLDRGMNDGHHYFDVFAVRQ